MNRGTAIGSSGTRARLPRGGDARDQSAAWRRAERAELRARADRDDAIREALAAGMTHRAIAEAVGVTYGRVGQIAAQRSA